MINGGKARLPLVALMGVDGSGKSSVLHIFRTKYASSLKAGLVVFHRGKITTEIQISTKTFDHHADQPYSLMVSILKLFVKAFGWLANYWIKIAALRKKGSLVIVDRFYFYDLAIDPLRYRYKGPLWLVNTVTWFMPKPDLYILLDAPAEVLVGRKSEIPLEEVVRQRQANVALVKNLPNGYIVDASQPLEKVADDTWLIIVSHISLAGA
jgi:thymidylate kinase